MYLVRAFYILLFVFSALLSRSLSLSLSDHSFQSLNKKQSFSSLEYNDDDDTDVYEGGVTKVKLPKRPIKAKGVQVLVPNICSFNFDTFYSYSKPTPFKGFRTYLYKFQGAHCKRGPPVVLS
jgi:hypothetical protein